MAFLDEINESLKKLNVLQKLPKYESSNITR